MLGGVTRHILPHLPGVPHLIVNRPLLLMLVCTWRHGGHVGNQEQKHFSPLELNAIFMQILQEGIPLYWPPIWPPCHVVANQEYLTIVFKSYYLACMKKWEAPVKFVEQMRMKDV